MSFLTGSSSLDPYLGFYPKLVKQRRCGNVTLHPSLSIFPKSLDMYSPLLQAHETTESAAGCHKHQVVPDGSLHRRKRARAAF